MCMMDQQQQQQQEMSSQTLESMLVSTKAEQEKKPTRPAEQQPQKCPRCDSPNTKFCYYNNYSLSQPRYFCKSCRRYWTKGGTLRNVPVGGGCRKNRRSSTSSSSKRSTQDNAISSNNNNIITSPISSYDSSTDLSLAFARLKQTNGHFGIDQEHDNNNSSMSLMNNAGNGSTTTFLDALRGYGFLENAPNHGMLYYGNMGQFAEHGDLGLSYDQEMSIGTTSTKMTTTTTATVKQEMCNMARSSEGHDLNNNSNNNNGKFSWGFPWQQMNGDHHVNNMNMSDFESTNRQSWNGFGGSNYFGLLNSPLM